MIHKCIKVSLRKDRRQMHRRLASHPNIQLGQLVHHQYTEALLAPMIGSIQVYKCLNIRDIKNLLIYLLTQHYQLLVFPRVSTTSLKIRIIMQVDFIILSYHIRPHNLVKDLGQLRLKDQLVEENKVRSCSQSLLRSVMDRTKISLFMKEIVLEIWQCNSLKNME